MAVGIVRQIENAAKHAKDRGRGRRKVPKTDAIVPAVAMLLRGRDGTPPAKITIGHDDEMKHTDGIDRQRRCDVPGRNRAYRQISEEEKKAERLAKLEAWKAKQADKDPEAPNNGFGGKFDPKAIAKRASGPSSGTGGKLGNDVTVIAPKQPAQVIEQGKGKHRIIWAEADDRPQTSRQRQWVWPDQDGGTSCQDGSGFQR